MKSKVLLLITIFTNNNYYNSILNTNLSLYYFKLDLKKVKNIKELLIIIFFKSSKKIKEVIEYILLEKI